MAGKTKDKYFVTSKNIEDVATACNDIMTFIQDMAAKATKVAVGPPVAACGQAHKVMVLEMRVL